MIVYCVNRRFFFTCLLGKSCKGPGKRGHIVADTNVSPFARERNICCGHKFCVRDTKTETETLYKNILCPQQKTILTIFLRFPNTFRRFPKILEKLSKGQTIVLEHFPKISEDYQRFPKITKDFRGKTDYVSIIE